MDGFGLLKPQSGQSRTSAAFVEERLSANQNLVEGSDECSNASLSRSDSRSGMSDETDSLS